MTWLLMVLGVVAFFVLLFILSLPALLNICAPSEVLVFTGFRRRVGPDRVVGYRVIKGGKAWRKPLIERVDRMDLTNIVIDLTATNAYSKGGIPLVVQGVANVKIAGHEPLLNNAIERFLGKRREEIMMIAKSTLEGSLRGVLATMTPEQVNEDKILFAEQLVQEVEQDMTALGLIVDTLKIQSVTDDVSYLDSIGRKRNAEVVSKARIAEAVARADSIVRSSENLQKESKAQIDAQTSIAKADADKRLIDIQTRRAALVAEELAAVSAMVAKARAELEVQSARVEQVRRQLEADVIQPAKAVAEAAEAQAKAEVAPILEEGRARAEALRAVVTSLEAAGEHGREVLLMQKLPSIIQAVTNVVAETEIERMTIIDMPDGGGTAGRALSTMEQIKQLFGVDLVEKIKGIGGGSSSPQAPAKGISAPTQPRPVESHAEEPAEPKEAQEPAPRQDRRPAPTQKERRRLNIELPPPPKLQPPSFELGNDETK
ncbi:MAG: flotillin family protein [Armatimonadetes bacterium]|nr:flotillin family protein [Armatimonadota bacterium]